MAITPTTLGAVINGLTAVIQNLTPTSIVTQKFRRCERERGLREWAAAGAGEAIFRQFEIVRAGPREDPGVIDPTATLTTRELSLLVAYPARLTGFFGPEHREDLGDVIDQDSSQLWAAIFDSANLVVGANAYIPQVTETDTSDPDAWFLDVRIRVTWFESTDLIT